MRVLVAGALANKPENGGEAWVRLSWIRALESLGFDVAFLEEAAHPEPGAIDWFEAVTARFGISAWLVDAAGKAVSGNGEPGDALAEADLLVNISGNLRNEALLSRPRIRAYVDIDPGFTQIWHAQGADLGLGAHEVHATVGERVGTPACPLPTGGFRWIPARQPVVLEDWPPVPRPARDVTFTTVASWRGYARVHWEGMDYTLKAHEFRKFAALPRLSGQRFEIALSIHPGDDPDRERLEANGWEVVPPQSVAATPDAFREFVQRSGAEFSVAQGVYVHTNSGWFSDRTVRYLATGRPAVVQDTGFAAELRMGAGLLPFSTVEDAVQLIREVGEHWEEHSVAARELAEARFAPDVALGRLLDAAGLS